MATIERRNLPPLNPATTITEKDRSRVYDLVREELADIVAGKQSYHPDGVQKDSQARVIDLSDFISSMQDLRGRIHDPSDVLGQVITDLESYVGAVRAQMEASEPVDNIELPPANSPSTADNNVIYVDPFPHPYAPPNPASPGQQRRSFRASGQLDGMQPRPQSVSSPQGSEYLRWPLVASDISSSNSAPVDQIYPKISARTC